MSEILREAASEHERNAQRYAAELLDNLGMPATYDDAVTLVAVAYLEGEIVQLRWARDKVRGDGETL